MRLGLATAGVQVALPTPARIVATIEEATRSRHGEGTHRWTPHLQAFPLFVLPDHRSRPRKATSSGAHSSWIPPTGSSTRPQRGAERWSFAERPVWAEPRCS